jgi:hypothetical protein
MACAPSYEIAGVLLGVEARNDFDLCYPFGQPNDAESDDAESDDPLGHMGIRPVECMLGHMRGRSEDTQSVSSDPTVPTCSLQSVHLPLELVLMPQHDAKSPLDIMPCARSDHSFVCTGTVASVGKLWTIRSAFYSVGQASRI